MQTNSASALLERPEVSALSNVGQSSVPLVRVLPTADRSQFLAFFRKKGGGVDMPLRQEDRLGWALTKGGQRVLVFRSHVSDEMLTREEFDAERAQLKAVAKGNPIGMFTGSKGFVVLRNL